MRSRAGTADSGGIRRSRRRSTGGSPGRHPSSTGPRNATFAEVGGERPEVGFLGTLSDDHEPDVVAGQETSRPDEGLERVRRPQRPDESDGEGMLRDRGLDLRRDWRRRLEQRVRAHAVRDDGELRPAPSPGTEGGRRASGKDRDHRVGDTVGAPLEPAHRDDQWVAPREPAQLLQRERPDVPDLEDESRSEAARPPLGRQDREERRATTRRSHQGAGSRRTGSRYRRDMKTSMLRTRRMLIARR